MLFFLYVLIIIIIVIVIIYYAIHQQHRTTQYTHLYTHAAQTQMYLLTQFKYLIKAHIITYC